MARLVGLLRDWTFVSWLPNSFRRGTGFKGRVSSGKGRVIAGATRVNGRFYSPRVEVWAKGKIVEGKLSSFDQKARRYRSEKAEVVQEVNKSISSIVCEHPTELLFWSRNFSIGSCQAMKFLNDIRRLDRQSSFH